MPRKGTSSFLQKRIAIIFPSAPLWPKPPGTSTPSNLDNMSTFDGSSSNSSVSIHSISTRQPAFAPECLRASFTLT